MTQTDRTNPATVRRRSDGEATTERMPAPGADRTTQFLRAAGICLLALPWGIALFTLLITGLALGAGLAITFVGIPILAWTLHLARLSARLERRSAFRSTGDLIQSPVRPGPSTWRECWTLIRDPAAWDDLARGLIRLPLGILTFTVTVVLLATSVSYMTAPLIYRWTAITTITGEVETLGHALLAVPQGVVVAVAATYIVPRMASRLQRSIRPA